MAEKILITVGAFFNIPGQHQTLVNESEFEILQSPHDHRMTADEFLEALTDVEAAIIGGEDCNAHVFQNAHKLKVISRYGVGYDRVDIDAATQARVIVTNTPFVNSVSVAEHAMALMLALGRHLPILNARVKSGGWGAMPAVEFDGRTLGIVGLGQIGRQVAIRAAAFGMKILYYDPYPPPDDLIRKIGGEYRELHHLMEQSDFVTIHVFLDESTRNLIDAEALSKMKPTAYLINTSRGTVVNEEALYEALKEKRIAGAALDVFEAEPPVGSPLLELDNLLATPHCSSGTVAALQRMAQVSAENTLAALRGERPKYVVNPEVYDKL
jgi:D-3-phosphoglycerate dehydrogenase